jgi:hypothetical protein
VELIFNSPAILSYSSDTYPKTLYLLSELNIDKKSADFEGMFGC